MPLPSATVIHEVSGRVRIQVPSKRRDPHYFRQVHQTLGQMQGVLDLQTNHVTGSILVRHERDLEAIRTFAEENGLFSIAAVTELALVLSRRMSGHVQDLDDRVINVTRGSWDLKSIVLLGLVTGAAIQVLKKQLLPPAASLLWYALALVWPHKGDHIVG